MPLAHRTTIVAVGLSVAAVVPTYRPASVQLGRVAGSLVAAGVPTLVADDASPCSADPVLRDVADAGAALIRHHRNRGVARSLNEGLRFAVALGADWLLTVDQDSTLPDGYVLWLLEAADSATAALGPDAVGAVAAGSVSDASGLIGYRTRHVAGVPTTEEVIQSGTLWRVAALQDLGGFDETFGIDAVDAAACVRLRASGRHVVVAPGLALEHRLGDARPVSILGRTVLATKHSPQRRTTIVRNRLRLAPEEFRQSPAQAFRTLRRVAVGTALAITIEEDRWAKAKASALGLLPRSRPVPTGERYDY